MNNNIYGPSLFIKTQRDDSTKFSLMLTTSPHKYVIRTTGGCGNMSEAYARGLKDLFVEAFQGYRGAFLFGGTRMVMKHDPSIVVPGITEVPIWIAEENPDVVLLGVVAKGNDMQLSPKYGLIVSLGKDKEWLTIVHPDQRACVIAEPEKIYETVWDAEYKFCLTALDFIFHSAQRPTLTVSYNGGSTTERELLETAHYGFPILLVQGGGGVTDELAADEKFLELNPHVHVCESNPKSLRNALIELGALESTQ